MFRNSEYPEDFLSRLTPSLQHALCRSLLTNLVTYSDNILHIDCDVVGPFPLMHIVNTKTIGNKRPLQATFQFGWRVLIVVDNNPILTMDCHLNENNMQGFFIQDGFSSINLYESLKFVEKRGRKNNWKMNSHQIKIIELPDLAKSCLWITRSTKGFLFFSSSTPIKNELTLHSWEEITSLIYKK